MATDPNSKTAIQLDALRFDNALAVLVRYADRRISTLKRTDLEAIGDAVVDLMGPVYRERDRRKQTPRGAAKLRLVAEAGELTKAGRHVVNGRRGGRIAAANRRAKVVTV